MFSPRGTLPPRPRGPNPSGTKPPGAFGAGGAAGPPRKAAPATPQGAPQRFSGQDALQWTGSQRINVRVTLHRADPRKVKEKTGLHQEQKADPRATRWDGGPCPAGTAGPKPPGPAPVSEQNSNPQNRYTPESASSILASFGLSNEDLEELSRYPDDQLTPENMPRILREIRIRKMGHAAPGLHAPSRGEEPAGESSGTAVKSKVIDYGHASKYGYTEDPLEIRTYDPEALPEEPLETRVFNPESSGAENREEFQREQSVPVAVPPPNVPCNPVFPAEDLIKLPAFPADSSPAPSFFPAEPPAKVPVLCGAAPAALPAVKPVSQPPMPPVLPPILPALLPTPLPQPMLPPVMPPLVQPVSQHVLPPLTPPPFSTGLLAAISQHEQKQRDAGSAHPGPSAAGGASAGHKPFHKPFHPPAQEPIKSPFGVVKASWLPVFPDQKSKCLPTPSMMNDYYATSPRIFPHLCSLCNLECTHMKDWILHQNNPAHLESCRRLRQQYPEWNPEAHSSNRHGADRKENRTPRRRSGSLSPSRRRSRGPPGPPSSAYRRRSRSRSPGRPRRPRSRSPGRHLPRPRSRSPGRHLPRPRSRSRSPQRPRSLARGSPRERERERRSGSAERARRPGSRSEARRAALEAVMQTLGPGFLAEFQRHRSLQAAVQGSLSAGRAPGEPRKGARSGRRDGGAAPGSAPAAPGAAPGSEREQEEEEETGKSQPYNRLLREELLSCGTVLQISDLPDSGFSDQDIKKLVQPFGKVSDLIVLRSRNEAYLEMNYKEAVIAAVRFGETAPLLLNGKRVRSAWPREPRKKKTVKKTSSEPKKNSNKHQENSDHQHQEPQSPDREKGKSEENPGREESEESLECGRESGREDSGTPAEAGLEIPGSEPSEPSDPNDPHPKIPHPNNPHPNPSPEPDGPGEPGTAAEAGPEPAVSEEPTDPGGKEGPEPCCVLLVSNLPAKGCSPQEISNLAKPFGGLRDLLILSSHKKAYLEIPRRAAESMVKFYGCFPMCLDGNQLRIRHEPRHRSLRDEEAIFIALIKESDPKAGAASLRSHLVHLGNLPAEGFRELELVCAGLRFGKVEHYAVLSNRRRAILQLDSPKSARSMHSFLQQYPYSIGEHTLTCSLSSHGDLPEAESGKKELKTEDGSKGSSGLKKIPEGSGTVQKPAGNPSGEARKGQIPTPKALEEIPAGQLEIPESQPGGAARESPAGMDVEGLDPGIGIPVDPAGSKSPGARSEEKPAPLSGAGTDKAQDEPGLEIQKEDEEPSAPAMESSSKAVPAAGGMPGAIPGMSPSSEEAPTVSPSVTQPSTEPAAPEETPVPEAGKSSHETSTERKTVPKTLDAPGKKLDVAGAEREATAEESVLKIAENPGKTGGKAETEPEKTPGKTLSKGGENSGNAVGEVHGGSSVKIPQNKGMGAAKSEENRAAAPVNPTASLKESCVGKTLLKAVVSVPDILKQRIPIRITEPSLGRAGEQKIPPKAGLEKKIPPKTAAQPGAGNSQWKGNGNSGVEAQGDDGKSSSQQERDSQLEPQVSSKQSQQGESRTSGTREDPRGNQAPGGGSAAAWKGGTGSAGKQKEEEELFPFNLDEFVTVDEVLEEAESPVMPRRNPPRGKRKEAPKANPSEPASKKRKGKSCGAEGELSFVTLDEIGEEEDAPVPLPGVDPQGLVVVDEVVEEEELSEAVKDPQALLTLDEISEQEEPGSHGNGPRAEFEERDLKAEPLVTVDEIGEVEELPLNEPAELSAAEEGKTNPGDCAASQVPDDPNALVTVDEIQEDNEDNPLVTLDEVNEDEDDFLADFNHLKEELNFVTVDEVGDEEEESTFPGKSLPEDEDDEDIVAVAGPEEMGILGDTNPEDEMAEISKPKAAQLGSEDAEPKSQQKKTTFPGVPKTQSTPKALDILVPKAGFFCQICSLFYADEPSMINHCRTPLHRQNMEKFMAKQQESGGEEPSSR
ncbi:zinc finger protein 638 isoform X3 [Haemorhous mexicanus]|uniref:zinc finger protein 638 isoform X3 n=1 Tax=Haemorhous mexicanus TaxID=30427 RepID=UPI0028BE094B|nr:zinc finger protein 638 isoform X3 [Haemorhous mexicanus]